MEIEYKKKKSSTFSTKEKEEHKTSEKLPDSPFFLSLAEKCEVYLASIKGQKNSEIAKNINRNPRTISMLISKAKKENTLDNQHSKKGRYRKGSSKITDAHKKFIFQWIQEGKVNSSHQIWVHLCGVKKLSAIGYDCVNNYLKSLGRWVKPRLKTMISERNLVKRRNYCLANRNVILNQDVLFTDETMFELNRNTTKVFKFKKDSMPDLEKLSTWIRQMAWAGISWRGKTKIIFIDGWINNKRYIDLLKNVRKNILDLFPEEFYFVQDNARPHVHKLSLRYIRRWITPHVKDHPPQSPDLNPIELVWGRLKNMVEARRPRDKNELKNAILECWEEIPMSFIRSCIGGLPSKMNKVLDEINIETSQSNNIMEVENSDYEEGYDSLGDEYDSEDISDEDFYESEDD